MTGKKQNQTVDGLYLSFSEVARRSDASPETVRRWVQKKLIGTHFVTGRQMIGAAELADFLAPKPLAPGVLLPGLTRPG